MNTNHPIWHDPIVAEIHATRDRLANQYQNDLVAYSKAAETHCRMLGFNVIEQDKHLRHTHVSNIIEYASI
ncbi:MAG: hypothetical protein Q8O31_04300 [Rhodocyclaceae bacterium]|nr:hypothetical protein [Rhodocyclaceae bacterium]